MFHKILIANRGEIACRIAATARRMGIGTVAVYSDADVQAKHVAACDEAVRIGSAPPSDSYLQPARIIAAALACGAQAIHPGYGFLSENADFARACAQAGLVFIGPPPEAIAAMGLKAESKRLMDTAGVPLVPGYQGQEQHLQLLHQEADRIGYPVLIKASAGGGGRGMRRVECSADFAAALASCQREAAASFGNDAVLIEKYVQRPRHIEMQIFADQHGNVVHLWERDCSVQRRHQKVLEEAPAPGLPDALRQQMGQAAIAAAKAVGYVGAGTVEFIVEQPAGYDAPEHMRFYFMEMNTRLQVEHPVTEAITGLDLVEWQLRIANGEPLPLAQAHIQSTGHAIEARICAENPDNDFLPATGTLAVYRTPPCQHFEHGTVRVDSGVREGDAISPHYDSMIAKLIVHGSTRQEALARLDAALARTHIVGIHNNVPFLRHVARSTAFVTAQLDTALIEREATNVFQQQAISLQSATAAAIAHVLQREQAQANPTDPFSRRDGWRSLLPGRRRFALEYAGQPITAWLTYGRAGQPHLLSIEGQAEESSFSFHPQPDNALEVHYAGQHLRAHVYPHGETFHLFTAHGTAHIALPNSLAHAGETEGASGGLAAPMPGKILSFAVQPGDSVRKGQLLAVMEAMKMEHTLTAPVDGTVQELLYATGDQVTEGAELLRLQPA